MNLQIDIRHEIENLKQNPSYIRQIIKLAENNWNKHPKEVKELMDAILIYTKDAERREDYIKVAICMSWYYATYQQYKEGTEKVLEAYRICQGLKRPRDLMRICNILLVLYMKQGLFEKALEYGLMGIELARKYNEKSSELTLLLNIAQVHVEVKEYEKALDLVTCIESGAYRYSKRQRLFIESILTEINLCINNIKEAKLHCEEAYKQAIQLSDSNMLAEVLYMQGQILVHENKSKEAKHNLVTSYEICKENDYKELILKGLISFSGEQINNNMLENAERLLLRALDLGKEINAVHLLSEVYALLEEIYKRMENWEKAYKAIKAREECSKEEKIDKNKMLLARLEQKNITKELQSYKRLYNQMKIISKVGQRFTANLDIDAMLDMIYEQVNQLVSADIVGLGMCKKNRDRIYKAYTSQGSIKEMNQKLYNRAIKLGELTVKIEGDIMVNDGNFKPYFKLLKEEDYSRESKIQSVICTKLKVDDVPIGVIGIGSYSKNAYTENDLRSLQVLGSYLAVALRNADLFNEVEYLAMYDALTGVYNRGTVLKFGEEQLQKNKVLNQGTAIMMLDIDHFKTINDQYGHLFGDAVLKGLGKALTENVRSGDFLGRYGGEEFIFILNNVSLEGAKSVAERVQESVRACCFINKNNEKISITISSGVYLYNMEESLEEGIRKADEALYEAKLLGRNRVVVYKEKENVI